MDLEPISKGTEKEVIEQNLITSLIVTQSLAAQGFMTEKATKDYLLNYLLDPFNVRANTALSK